MAKIITNFTVDEAFASSTGWAANSGSPTLGTSVNPVTGDPCFSLTAGGSLGDANGTFSTNQNDGGLWMLDVHATTTTTPANFTIPGTYQMFLGTGGFASYMDTTGWSLFPGMNRLMLGRRPRVGGTTFAGMVFNGAGAHPRMTYAIVRAIGAANCQYRISKMRSGGWSRGEVFVRIDDGLESVYTYMYPKLSALGIKATLGIITSKIGTAGYMTWDQVDTLYAAGWDVVNHTHNHNQNTLTSASVADCLTEIRTAKNILATRGYTRAGMNDLFINPFGESGTNYNQALTELGTVQAFSTISRPGSLWYDNPLYYPSYNADSFDGGGAYSAGYFQKWIDRMQYGLESGGNVVPLLHSTTSGTPSAGTQMKESEFDAFCGWLARIKGIATTGNPLTELVRQLQENGVNPA